MDSVDDIVQRLYRSDVSMMTSEQKVETVLTELTTYDKFKREAHDMAEEYSLLHRKNVELATDVYDEGLSCLQSEDYNKAVDCFTEALRCCPFPTDSETNLLSNCYRQRSLAFRKLGQTDNASFDENQCSSLTDTNLTNDYDDYDDCDPNDHSFQRKLTLIETKIHEKVALKTDDLKGRYFETTEKIGKRQIILVEKPFACVLYNQWLTNHCSNCFKRVDLRFWPCGHCDEVVFCDRRCARVAWFKYHRHECGIVGLLCQHIPKAYLAYRIITRVGCRRAIELRRETSGTDITQNWLVSSDTRAVDLIDAYKAFLSLFDHSDSVNPKNACFQIVHSIYMAFYMQFMSVFDHNDSDLPAFVSFVALIKTHINKIDINSFSMFNRDHEDIGIAVMYLGSIFSHSCDPNVQYRWIDGNMVYFTLSKINAGHELFVCYGPYYRTANAVERRKHLSDFYHFVCHCSACLSEFGRRNALRCRACRVGAIGVNEYTKQGQCLECGQSYASVEEITSRIEAIRGRVCALLESIDAGVDVDESVRLIESFVDEMRCYVFDTSVYIVELKEYLAEICSKIERFDLAVKYGLQLIPEELVLEDYADQSLMQLLALTDDFVRYLNGFGVTDGDQWLLCVSLHELLMQAITHVMSGQLDSEDREAIDQLWVEKRLVIDQLLESIETMFPELYLSD